MQKKPLFFAGIFVCLFVAGFGYYQYQKPRTGTSGIAPDFSLAAEQLYTEYNKDEAAADKKIQQQSNRGAGCGKRSAVNRKGH